ncbi:MAG: lipopolysaccharide biosynthesis protein [Bryobacteraceae bacterium]
MSAPGLDQKVRSAYLWTIAGNATKYLLGFGLSMLLARLLEPRDYGIVGMVLVITGLLSVIQDLGLGQAVIYFKDDESALPTFFTVTTVMGALFTALTFLSAPLIAAFYNAPVLVPIVQALSFTLFLSSLKSVSQGVILKRFQFKEIAVVETVCALGSAAVAVVMAWKGFGVWSLVTNLLLQAFLPVLFILWIVRPHFTLHIDRSVMKRLLRWGLPLTGSSLLWKFYVNSDYLVIGKLMGTQALGFYTLAFRMATLVDEKIVAVVSRVSFPTFSAMQDRREEAVAHWFSLTRRLALINFPLLTALALNAQDLVAVLLGEKWLPSVEPLRFLCMVGLIRTLTPVMSTLISARGRTDISFRYSLLNSIILPVAFIIGCTYGGLRGVGIAWMAVLPVNSTFLLLNATRLMNASLEAYFRNIGFPLLVSAACLLAMLPALLLLPAGFGRLCASGASGLACYLLCLGSQPVIRQRVLAVLAGLRKGRLSSALQ